MSRRNSREAKALRRKERLERPLPLVEQLKLFSFCTLCGDYTTIWEPGRFCKNCLEEAS